MVFLSFLRLLEQFRIESDQTTKLNLIKEIEQLGASDYFCMYLLNRNSVFLTHDWITGVESSGSTFPWYVGLRFQYMSKGDLYDVSSSTTNSDINNTRGFSTIVTLAVFSIIFS